MIYFDNAATGGRKPDTVLTALSSAVKVCANPGRSGHKLSLSCAAQVENCRNELDSFFDGYGFDRVIFTKNCTEALNVALFGVLRKGDHVIASCMEHNSVLRPLEYLRKQGVITYDICPLLGDGASAYLHPDDILSLLKPNTRLVAVTTASNVTGYTPNLTAIRKILPENVLFLCDGAQGAGHIDLKMKGAGIDLLTIAGHKGMFGIQGSGALLFSDRVEPTPLLYGGTGSMSISLDMPDFYPDVLEAGTLAFPAISSLLEGVRYLTFHQSEIERKLLSLSAYLLQELSKMTDYTAYSLANSCGIVAFRHSRLQSEIIADALSNNYNIAVRGGLHCAPLMHEALGTLDGGLVRVSFSHYNSEKEIDTLIFALKELNHL
jgi:cysteine desulfurase family protein